MTFGLEMLKFSVYILFPVGVLFLYNEPDFLSQFPSSQRTVYDTFKTDPDKLFVSQCPADRTETAQGQPADGQDSIYSTKKPRVGITPKRHLNTLGNGNGDMTSSLND